MKQKIVFFLSVSVLFYVYHFSQNYNKKKYVQKQGKIIILNGVSRSGKTSLANCLLKQLGVRWQKVERDDFVAQLFIDRMNGTIEEDEFMRRMKKKIDDMHTMIKELINSGKNIILDTVLSSLEGDISVRRDLEYLKDFEVCLVLVYCPLHVVVQRLKDINKKAFFENNIKEMRSVFATLHYLSMYRPKGQEDEISIGSLSSKDIEISYCESKQEFRQVVERLKKVRSLFFSTLGLNKDKINCVKIVPKLVYDLIVDTSKNSEQECAKQVYDFIGKNKVVAFGLNCKKLGIKLY